ncbi:uncharacterized membrane protein YbhN (UPF0104 family) [Lysobacter enzymogenes]|uniref:lysylphosphatidylglycerol synthase transmembrane domain-containing protein n=1 Tax=Lysobacter enzymogenes TaxID=69 RepID=UPI003393903E
MFERRWLRLALFLAAIAAIAWYCVANPEVLHRAMAFGWLNVIVLALSYSLSHVLNALVLKAGLEPPYRGIRLSGLMGITMASSLAGYLTPLRVGGLGTRLLMLRVRYGVSPGYVVGQFLLVTLLTIGLSSIMFVIVVLAQGAQMLERYRLAIGGMALVGAGVVVMCAVLSIERFYVRVRFMLPKALAGAHDAMSRPARSQIKIVALLAVSFLLQVLQTQWLLISVGIRSDWVFSALVCAAANLMLVLSLTPGNLGVKEALLGSLSLAFSIDEKAFLGALLVDRFVQLAVLAAGTLLYFFLDRSRLRSKR